MVPEFGVIFIIIRLGIVTSLCHDGWYPDNQQSDCFRLYRAPLLTWNQATVYCQENKSELANLRKRGQQRFLYHSVFVLTYWRGHLSSPIVMPLNEGSARKDLGTFGLTNVGGIWIRGISNTKGELQEPMAWKEDNNNDFEWTKPTSANRPSQSGPAMCMEIIGAHEEYGRVSMRNCNTRHPFLCKNASVQELSMGDSDRKSAATADTTCQPYTTAITLLSVSVFCLALAILSDMDIDDDDKFMSAYC